MFAQELTKHGGGTSGAHEGIGISLLGLGKIGAESNQLEGRRSAVLEFEKADADLLVGPIHATSCRGQTLGYLQAVIDEALSRPDLAESLRAWLQARLDLDDPRR